MIFQSMTPEFINFPTDPTRIKKTSIILSGRPHTGWQDLKSGKTRAAAVNLKIIYSISDDVNWDA